MSREMFVRRSVQQQRIVIAIVAVIAGAALASFQGIVGLFLLVPALAGLGGVWMRGKRPLVKLDESNLLLQMGKEQTIRLSNVVKATKTSDTMFEIRLKSGETVPISIANLEDDDATELGRALKRNVPKG